MRPEGLQQQRRGKRVQAIALCKKLGLTYSTTTDLPAPRKQKRLKKPPTPQYCCHRCRGQLLTPTASARGQHSVQKFWLRMGGIG